MSASDAKGPDLTLLWQALRAELIQDRYPGSIGIMPNTETKPAEALQARLEGQDVVKGSRSAKDLQDTLLSYAFSRGIDASQDGWPLDVVAHCLVEHPFFAELFGVARGPGRPKVPLAVQYRQVFGVVFRAAQLKAIMQIHRRSDVSDAELARQMVFRLSAPDKCDHLAEVGFAWPDDVQFTNLVDAKKRRISAFVARYRELTDQNAHILKKPPIFGGRQDVPKADRWIPSETELERYPTWKKELLQILRLWRVRK